MLRSSLKAHVRAACPLPAERLRGACEALVDT